MSHATPAPKGSFLSNRTYDILKFVAQIFLPAVGTLYFAVAGIWGIDGADKVVGTIMAVDAFLGVILGVSSSKYPGDGDIKVSRDDEGNVERYSMELNTPAEDLATKDAVTFKVKEDDQ